MSDRLRRILAWVPLGLELTLGFAATLLVVRLLSQQERGAAQAEFVRRATLSTSPSRQACINRCTRSTH